MKFYSIAILFFSITLLFAKEDYRKGELLIKLRQPEVITIKATQVINGTAFLQNIFQKYNLKKTKACSFVDQNTMGWYLLKFPEDADLKRIKKELKTCSDIKEATYNKTGILCGTPNDPLFTDQWNLALMNAEQAWDLAIPNEEILVGILDSGIDYNHFDLSDNIWSNPDEIPADGIDNDNNGYIDDIRGWNFVDDNSDIQDITEAKYHGTRVAGVVSARTYNASALSGIAGGWQNANGVKLIGLRIVDYTTHWNEYTAGDALAYLIILSQRGFKVIANMSFQTITELDDDYIYFKDMVTAARQNGVIMFAASGNVQSRGYYQTAEVFILPAPARWVGVMAIGESQYGASLPEESRYAQSTYGTGLKEVIAVCPGHNFISGINTISTLPISPYYTTLFTGTSAACPMAVGTASLLLSVNSSLEAFEIQSILIHTSKKIGNYIYLGSPSYTNEVGYGRVDAYEAVKYTIENYGGTLGGLGQTVVFHEDFIIKNGNTLTFRPGTIVKFDNSVTLTMAGTLNAHGTAANPITFDRSGTTGTWGGIKINSSGNADFEYCNIKNASLGLEADNCGTISIEHSKFIDCGTGISADGLSSIAMEGTEITGYNYTGSYIDIGSSLDAYASLITLDDEPGPDFSQIALKNYGGDITFSLGALYCNGQGLYNEYGSWANLGEEYEENGQNTIVCNLIDINTNEDMLAQENYWGGDEPDNFDGDGDVEYDPWLDEDDPGNPYGDGDCSSFSKAMAKSCVEGEASTSSKFATDDYKLYKQSQSKLKKEDFSAAVSDFESLIAQYPESFFARFALQKWLLIKFKLDSKSDILPYLSSLKESKSVSLTDYVNQMDVLTYRKLKQPNTALSLATTSVNKSKSDLYNSFFKYQEGLIYKNDLKNLKQAETSFNEYLQQYPNDGRTQLVQNQLNILSAATQPLDKDSEAEKSSAEESENLPDKFELSAAYPNPFNPSTTFRFASPWDGVVKVEIYNSLGQRVRLFDTMPFAKGTNKLVWNGRNDFGNMVTSGVYFVRFTAESELDKSQRFEGFSKVIFLK